jgi:hypothetical protein
MKTKMIAIVFLAAGLHIASAADKSKVPHRGRIIDAVHPCAEFLISNEQKIEIRFIDGAGKTIVPTAQVVTVTMGNRTNPTKLLFIRVGDILVSERTIPAGKDLPVVVQIKNAPDAKPVYAKFNLNLAMCSTCPNAEYACACDH